MTYRDVLELSWKSLFRNRRRAALTMLGIVIGVASVILMLSVGHAAENYILSQVASFGSDLLFVRNGPGDGSTGAGPPTMTVKQTLRMNDYKDLRKQSWVTAVSAMYYQDLLVEYQSASSRKRVSGVTESDAEIFNTKIAVGRFLSEDEVDSRARVAVLGSDVAEDLFGQEDPIGKRIKVQKLYYRVIGVLEPAGTRFFTNLDQSVYVPVTSLMQALNKDRLQFVSVKIGDLDPVEAQERIRVLLRENHNLDNPEGELEKDDFFVATQEDTAERAGVIGFVLQILLVSIAAISLVVGGVGIMNIMFVTVTERTREIGLRKAIGARKRDILRQFLYEAVMICLFGGVLGAVAGIAFSWLGIWLLVQYQSPSWVFVFPMDGVLWGMGVSMAIGMIFGYYPAKQAAELNPIRALQYE